MDSGTTFDEFLKFAAPNLERRCCAIFACVYAQTDHGWTNLASSVVLAPGGWDLDGHVSTCLFDMGGFRAMRVLVPPEKVKALLRGIVTGHVAQACLPGGCDEVRFVGRKDGAPFEFSGSTADVRDLSEYGLPLQGHVLHASGNSGREFHRHEQWREVAARLPASDPPFADLDAVVRDLRIRPHLGYDESMSVTLVAPYWLRIGSAEIRHDEASIELSVCTRWRDVSRSATVSLIPENSAFVRYKKRIALGDSDWETSNSADGWVLMRRKFLVGKRIGPCDLSLNYGERQIEAITVGLGSARVIAHELIDPEFRHLRSRLFERKGRNDPGRQEEGVAWLLHLCGMSVARYGYKNMQRATDVIAFLGDHAAIYAECSLERPSMDKLKDIESRADALRSRLREQYGQEIILVRAIFVALKRSDLGHFDVESAHKHARAIYICDDDMEKLIEMARRGESPLRCFSFIAQRGEGV